MAWTPFVCLIVLWMHLIRFPAMCFWATPTTFLQAFSLDKVCPMRKPLLVLMPFFSTATLPHTKQWPAGDWRHNRTYHTGLTSDHVLRWTQFEEIWPLVQTSKTTNLFKFVAEQEVAQVRILEFICSFYILTYPQTLITPGLHKNNEIFNVVSSVGPHCI